MKRNYRIAVAALFLSAALQAQDYSGIIRNYLDKNEDFRSSNLENRQFQIGNQDKSESLGGTVLYVQQTFGGIPVYGAGASAVVKDGKVAHFSENFSKGTPTETQRNGKISKEAAFSSVLNKMQLQEGDILKIHNGNLAEEVYFPVKNSLVLAYNFEFEEKSGQVWNVVADASSGKILLKDSLTYSCSFADEDAHQEFHNSQNRILPENKPSGKSNLFAAESASYRVFALPLEAPTFGGRTLVTNPWDLEASPKGWHEDGGRKYTTARGNNVFAYLDLDSVNPTLGQTTADGGAERVFDFPLDLNQHHSTYADAAITNVFYMTNMMHDITYRFGFTESARNFQYTNFTGEGKGLDHVLAEARDGNGASDKLNNANFSSPRDGFSGRMQMYLWSPTKIDRVFYNSPENFRTRRPVTQTASFGPALTAEGVTGGILPAEPKNGCGEITNDLSGSIALIERGSCNFTEKVKNAQNKGAVAVMIYNTATGSWGGMGGSDDTITIPAVMVQAGEGAAILEQLKKSPVNVTIKDDKSTYIYRDSDFDNGIIAHEYAHGVSNRLTGSGVGALSTAYANEQMGEGWSDFFTLMLTNRPGATASVARSVGTYVNGEGVNGGGIRPAKYSPDFSVNNFTYGKTNGMYYKNAAGKTVPDVHAIGFVWGTMLWDLHWKYAEKYGYQSNVLADKNSGSARVFQLVMDGMKIQGNYPNFVSGRDALIAADEIATKGENKCLIWEVFAKRGLGVKADPGVTQPNSDTAEDVMAALNDQKEDFTLPESCILSAADTAATASFSVYPNPAKDKISIRFTAGYAGKTDIKIFDASGKLVLQDQTDHLKDGIDVARLQPGVYILKAENLAGKYTKKIVITQ